MKEKETKLLKLMTKIHVETYKMDTEFKTAWFYPEYDGVKGFLGTNKIVFAGISPSYGMFTSKPVKFFYECLKKYGFENAHITDIIKSRLTRKQFNRLKDDSKLFDLILGKNIEWLNQELKIIDSNLNVKIIGIGKDALHILKRYFKDMVDENYLPHYSWVESYSEEKKRQKRLDFIKKMQEI